MENDRSDTQTGREWVMGIKKTGKTIALLATFVATFGLGTAAKAAGAVHIVYGYHPYWTGGWNGVIIKAKKLWQKYLPAGSTVRFEPFLTGPPMVNGLLANKIQVATMGDMPALVATTKRQIADLRLASVPMFSDGQNCNKIVVRKDAPHFANVDAAMKWIDGRVIAVTRGTCANRFLISLVKRGVIKPKRVLFTSIEVITSDFKAGKLDAAAMWEPHARRVVDLGDARYAATGAPWGEVDADFTVMREDFIKQHPEAAAGWIKAEIAAVKFMIDHPKETSQIISKEVQGYTPQMCWDALYEKNPAAIGGAKVNYVGKFVFDAQVLELMKKDYAFLHSIKVLPSPDIPPHAYDDGPVKQALKELGMTAPVGEIIGQAK